MEYKLDFRELEKKYDYKIKYPGVYRVDIKTRLMEKLVCVYTIMRKKLVRIFPLSDEEEMYNSFRRKHSLKKESNSPENKEAPFFTNKFIHMYDFVPKENMERLIREIGQFKKKHIRGSGGIGDEDERASELKSLFSGSFRIPVYSFGIKEQSKLYNYISEIYIDFQELTTSINTVLYTIVLNESLIGKLNKICIDDIDDLFVLSVSNWKWYEFYKMGYATYSARIYKAEFINACIKDIKWNVIKTLRKDITFYLIDNQEILPSVNVYHTNIDGNRNAQFWQSIQVEEPESCDFTKNGIACINWSRHTADIDYIYKSTRGCEIYESIYPMDIKYFYSQFLVRRTIIQQTYSRIEKYMETCDEYNVNHIKLKKWLAYKAKIERQSIYYKRFYNEQKEEMYDTSDFVEMFSKSIGNKKSITERLIEKQFQSAKEAYTALNQALDYINNNIEYRSSIENYRVQSRTLFFTFISMAVATLALIVTCMTSEDVSEFIADYITSAFEWINAMLRYVGRYRNCM